MSMPRSPQPSPGARAGALLALAALVLVLPALLGAQGYHTRTVVEGYVGQARLESGLLGDDARLTGAGARLLVPLAAFSATMEHPIARRLAVGGFVTSTSADDDRVRARHVGVQADLSLTDRWLAGRVEPLVSLGVGAFRARRLATDGLPVGTLCLRPAVPDGAGCDAARAAPETPVRRRAPTVTPGLGARIALLPGLALRADVRDVIVYDGPPRHGAEVAVGVSFIR